MRKIVVSIQNGLLAEAITGMLNDSGEFQPFRVPVGSKKNDVISSCEMLSADILIAEVSYASGTTVEARLREVKDADLRAIVEPKGQPAVLVYQHPIYHDRPDGIAPCVQNPRLLFQGADEQGHHRSCRSRSVRATSPLPAILSSLPARRTACSVSTIPTAARTQKNDGPLRIFPIKSAIYGSLPSKNPRYETGISLFAPCGMACQSVVL